MKNEQLSGRQQLERGCELYEGGKFTEALDAFLNAATLGDVNAQVNLANMYDDGEGTTQDHKKAIYWYKEAIRRGSSEGAYNLAISYRNRGITRWFNYWLQKAAQLGDEDAIELSRGMNSNP